MKYQIIQKYLPRLKNALDTSNNRYEKLTALLETLQHDNAIKGYDETLYPALPPESCFDKRGMAALLDESGRLKTEGLEEALRNSPVAQLMYLFVWKNGGLKKLAPLRSGLLGEVLKTGPVFQQFARHVIDRNEPIVDQHTIRAYLYLKNGDKKTMAASTSQDQIAEYSAWINDVLPSTLENRKETLSVLDKIMFIIGKNLKVRKSAAANPQ